MATSASKPIVVAAILGQTLFITHNPGSCRGREAVPLERAHAMDALNEAAKQVLYSKGLRRVYQPSAAFIT